MLKRRGGLPRNAQWLVGITAAVLALVVIWVVFVPATDWLAHHDIGSAKGSLHETAVDNARGRLLTLAAGIFAVGALIFTARNFALSREGQVTDRFSKAIDHLGSSRIDVRIGGIYALERVARDSAKDHLAVMEVLTTFIRRHSRKQWPPLGPESQPQQRSVRPDVQAAVTAVGRWNARRDTPLRRMDLTGADLRDVDLRGLDLRDAILVNVDLTGADLTGAWWPKGRPSPDGWKPNASSGRLERLDRS